MKLLFCFTLFFMSCAYGGIIPEDFKLPRFDRFDNSRGGLRAVWSCPTGNRGNMPEEKEIRFSYDKNGNLKFSPDIFKKKFDPIKAISSLFGGGKERPSSDLDECLRAFLNTIPTAVTDYQQSRCSGSSDLICLRSSSDISTDVAVKIRQSNFYGKYESELRSLDLPRARPELPQEVIPVVRPETRPEVVTRAERDPVPPTTTVAPRTKESPIARPEVDSDLARTRLLDYLIANNSSIAEVKEFAKHCPQLDRTTGVNMKNGYCVFFHNKHNAFLTRLSQMFSAVRGESVPVERLLESLECLPPRSERFGDLEDILHSLERKDDCSPLAKIGDYKVFKKESGDTRDWYTSGNYLLKKTGDNSFEAVLNLDFKSMNGSTTPAQMMGKVRGCLSSVNPYLKGPGGGQLAIKVLSPAEAASELPMSERPLPGTITISSDDAEVNSGNFTPKIDCPTITHELLHHLGLCDEYKEGRTNILPGMTRSRAVEWSCRVVPTAPSIMKDHIQAFENTVPKQFSCRCNTESCNSIVNGTNPQSESYKKVMIAALPSQILRSVESYCRSQYDTSVGQVPEPGSAYANIQKRPGFLSFQNRRLGVSGSTVYYSRQNITCQCPSGDVDCERAINSAVAKMEQKPVRSACPAEMVTMGEPSSAAKGSTSQFGNGVMTVVTNPQAESLLSPNHFDKILTGSCPETPPSIYKSCSHYAYISNESESCKEKPPACSDDSAFFGGSSPQ